MRPELTAAFDLRGLTALVVGATGVPGFRVARALGLAGARLMLSAPDATALETAMQDLQDLGIDTRWVAADCASDPSATHLVKSTLERMGDIDVLVTALPDPALARRVSEAVVQGSMLTQGWGRIVHLGGVPALGAVDDAPLAQLVRAQASAWRSRGLCVNAILQSRPPAAGVEGLALDAASLLFAGPSGLGFSGQWLVIDGAANGPFGE